jgi:hypothetical protein
VEQFHYRGASICCVNYFLLFGYQVRLLIGTKFGYKEKNTDLMGSIPPGFRLESHTKVIRRKEVEWNVFEALEIDSFSELAIGSMNGT